VYHIDGDIIGGAQELMVIVDIFIIAFNGLIERACAW
jgi:hypothetical protein